MLYCMADIECQILIISKINTSESLRIGVIIAEVLLLDSII